jgi:hypothetical protein
MRIADVLHHKGRIVYKARTSDTVEEAAQRAPRL